MQGSGAATRSRRGEQFAAPFLDLPSRAGSIVSIAYLRGLAVLLVLWDHVIAGWTARHQRSWVPLDVVRDWITSPLAIIQDFGFIGVAIFFLLSGYIVSDVAVRETRRVFATKRLLRIYPALIVSVLLIDLLDRLKPSVGQVRQGFGVGQSLWAMTLVNYVRKEQAPVNGVAWSLVVEMLFYLLVFISLPVLRKWPVAAIAGEMAVIWVVVITARDFPIDRYFLNWFLLAASFSYLPLLVVGQAVWLWRTGRASPRVAAAVGVGAWLLFVLSIRRVQTSFLPADNSYGVNAAFAVGIFLLFIVNERRLKMPAWIAAISVLSYSTYLVHGPVTDFVMEWLPGGTPFTLRLVAALAVLALVIGLLWRFVELPAQHLARRATAGARARES